MVNNNNTVINALAPKFYYCNLHTVLILLMWSRNIVKSEGMKFKTIFPGMQFTLTDN